jgi:hypothetical protein
MRGGWVVLQHTQLSIGVLPGGDYVVPAGGVAEDAVALVGSL